jgi:hypothetical protein
MLLTEMVFCRLPAPALDTASFILDEAAKDPDRVAGASRLFLIDGAGIPGSSEDRSTAGRLEAGRLTSLDFKGVLVDMVSRWRGSNGWTVADVGEVTDDEVRIRGVGKRREEI